MAFVNSADRNHRVAFTLFEGIKSNQISQILVASSAYSEYEMVYRSKGIPGSEIKEELTNFLRFPNLGESPLNGDVILKAIECREKTKNLTYYDSLHAATAFLADGEIISNDPIYDDVPQLIHFIPSEFIKDLT